MGRFSRMATALGSPRPSPPLEKIYKCCNPSDGLLQRIYSIRCSVLCPRPWHWLPRHGIHQLLCTNRHFVCTAPTRLTLPKIAGFWKKGTKKKGGGDSLWIGVPSFCLLHRILKPIQVLENLARLSPSFTHLTLVQLHVCECHLHTIYNRFMLRSFSPEGSNTCCVQIPNGIHPWVLTHSSGVLPSMERCSLVTRRCHCPSQDAA